LSMFWTVQLLDVYRTHRHACNLIIIPAPAAAPLRTSRIRGLRDMTPGRLWSRSLYHVKISYAPRAVEQLHGQMYTRHL
jgi:hypothetical protein